MACEQVHEDWYGAVIDHGKEGFIEIRWYDTTSEMSADEFKNWLSKFADLVDQRQSKRVLVDGTSFQMNSMEDTMDWRYEVIIPRYNAAGITKFAFHLPAGSPPIGSKPAPDGPANFPTGYFASREETMEWLAT